MIRTDAAPAVQALACAKCGGSLEIRESAPLARCAYCRVAFLVKATGGSPRLIAAARVEPVEAERAVRELLRHPACPADLAASATRVSRELLYIPFWRFRATVVGRVKGVRDIISRRPLRNFHGNEDGLGSMTVQMQEVRVGEEEVIEEIQRIWQATVSACPLDDLGVPSLGSRRQMAGGLSRLAPGAALPGLALAGGQIGEGRLIDPMVPLQDASLEADRLFDRFTRGRGADLRDRELAFERLQDRSRLLFYPIYRIVFQYRRRLFEATVDGLEGRIVRARLPAKGTGRSIPLVALAAGGGWAGGTFLRAVAIPSSLAPELTSLARHPAVWILALGAAACWVWALRKLALASGSESDDIVVAP